MRILKKFFIYLIAPILSLTLFTIIFQLWKVDFTKPFFSYQKDFFVTALIIKNIIESGWFFSNKFVGFPHISEIFYLHDFPVNADTFNFFVIRIFSFFSSDAFLVLNCFFIFTIALVSLLSFVALRSFKISIFTATLISVLYSFLPYHFYRGIENVLLSNYAIIPLSVMVALWIASDKIVIVGLNKKQQYHFSPNKFFWLSILVSLFSAFNGIYYALYSAVIFVFAAILASLKKGKFFNNMAGATIFSVVIILTLLCLYLPCFSYWMSHGMNGAVANRDAGHSDYFALKIVSLLLPVENHYFYKFSEVRNLFNNALWQVESGTESLGIIGAAGFLFLFLWLIAKSQISGDNSFLKKTIKKFSLSENDQNLISNLSGLNLMVILFATVGGLVMLIVVSFPMIRSHARFCVFIAFFSMFLAAIIFDKIAQKKKISAYIFLSLIFILGIFDQVGKVSAQTIQTQEMKIKFDSDRDFVQRIEKTLPKNSAIFQMPLKIFPESDSSDLMVGYLHSKNLGWSYPAMDGREAFSWQKEVVKLPFAEFISALKKAGFAGIYIDRITMTRGDKKYSWQELRNFEKQLKKISKKPAIVSQNLQLIFFEI